MSPSEPPTYGCRENARASRCWSTEELLQPRSHNPATAGPAALVIYSRKSGSTMRELRLSDIGVVLYDAAHGAETGWTRVPRARSRFGGSFTWP